MKVPVRSTGSAAHRRASAGKEWALAATANVDEFDCVVMPATVKVGTETVDYPVGNVITSPVTPGAASRQPRGVLAPLAPAPLR